MKIQTRDFLDSGWEVKEIKNRLLVERKKIGRGWHNAKSFLLPKEIELDKNTVECIGLYLGDGKTTDNDELHANFTSKDFDLVRKMIKFLHKLGAKNSDITFTLSYNKEGLKNAKLNFFL